MQTYNFHEIAIAGTQEFNGCINFFLLRVFLQSSDTALKNLSFDQKTCLCEDFSSFISFHTFQRLAKIFLI